MVSSAWSSQVCLNDKHDKPDADGEDFIKTLKNYLNKANKDRYMLTPEAKAELERQQYRVVGSHSAIKPCGWLKSMIKGDGGCYKLKFYGIMSNQCLQMTTSLSCANRCTFCWRGYKAPVSKEWTWGVDDPKEVFDESIKAHHKMLIGFAGSKTADKEAYEASKTVKHVALSLTGEPIMYPKLNGFIDECNKEKISTFLVTNGQYPEQIKDLKPVTQFYMSLDAPTKELMQEIDRPLFPDFWERANKSLVYLSEKKQRTAIRLTMIKGINDKFLQEYADLIQKGGPDFIEVKAYMFVGQSRERLKKENMPLHEEVVEFSKKLVGFLAEYELISEHIPSRVVMLAKKKFLVAGTWNTWIDFDKWDGSDISALDYSRETPEVGISGKGTLDQMPDDVRERFLKEKKLLVNEDTHELEFYEE